MYKLILCKYIKNFNNNFEFVIHNMIRIALYI